MFFEDFFGGGMPGGGHGGMRSSREPVDTDKLYETLGVEKKCNDQRNKKGMA